jgi:hypothetical protein
MGTDIASTPRSSRPETNGSASSWAVRKPKRTATAVAREGSAAAMVTVLRAMSRPQERPEASNATPSTAERKPSTVAATTKRSWFLAVTRPRPRWRAPVTEISSMSCSASGSPAAQADMPSW